jgi:hypothetical protein
MFFLGGRFACVTEKPPRALEKYLALKKEVILKCV